MCLCVFKSPAVKPSIQFFVESSFKLFYTDIDRSKLFSYLHHILALYDRPVVPLHWAVQHGDTGVLLEHFQPT